MPTTLTPSFPPPSLSSNCPALLCQRHLMYISHSASLGSAGCWRKDPPSSCRLASYRVVLCSASRRRLNAEQRLGLGIFSAHLNSHTSDLYGRYPSGVIEPSRDGLFGPEFGVPLGWGSTLWGQEDNSGFNNLNGAMITRRWRICIDSIWFVARKREWDLASPHHASGIKIALATSAWRRCLAIQTIP